MSVPTTAGFDPGLELMPHQQVKFAPVAITTTGYMYVWVSNESEDTKVWFDDLAITQSQDIVTQATDYGVWGDVLREQKTNVLDEYRYGYQGKYAEEDDETGWNHFELREYDAVIGRWFVPDPARQYFSPYLSMGNNPINRLDPDGGEDWIPQVDKNGNTTYIAEAGDNINTFVDQFNVTMDQALEIFSNNGYTGIEGPFSLGSIAEGTTIMAPFLQYNLKITDPAWYKPSYWSKDTQQKAINHVVFALDYAKSNGKDQINLGDIFNFDKGDFSGSSGFIFSGSIGLSGSRIPISIDAKIMWHSVISVHPTPRQINGSNDVVYDFNKPGSREVILGIKIPGSYYDLGNKRFTR